MKSLSHYIQDKQTQVFNDAGAFFAFSNQQFAKAKQQGIEYVSIGAGLICPPDKAKQLINRLATINKEGIKQDIEDNGKDAIIRRELFNYECFYSGDIMDCVENLTEYGYCFDDIHQVYRHICQTENVC